MGGSMSIIVPGIYVGGISSAKSEAQLDENRITHICSALHYPLTVDQGRIHKQFLVRDSPDEDLSKHFLTAAEFIHSGRVSNGSVLVHCACGISRSVSFVIAYLLCITDFSLSDLYKALRAARVGACPNTGFLRQLQHFEKTEAHKQGRKFLIAQFGEWPPERAALDSQEINRLIAIQDEFIRTGYYPGDVRPPESRNDATVDAGGDAGNSSTDSPQPKPTSFFCRLRDTQRTLEEALSDSRKRENTEDFETLDSADAPSSS
uniref:Dual specificity protein phosphatase 22 n=1 Tax=Schistocephalus solidus TaxID=70667 RepID=A0A0X3NYR2_SCHSO